MNNSFEDIKGIRLELKWLNQLLPINELQIDAIEKLTNKSTVIDVDKGFVFEASDEYRWLIYLLSGEVNLISSDQSVVSVAGNSERAHHPLFSEKAHRIKAIANSPSRFVRFDRQFFSLLFDESLLRGEEFETIEVNESEGHLFNTIAHAFNQGLLELPSLPEIALKVKEAVADPDVNINNLVRIIEADPALVARLIQVANSPMHRGRGPVQSIRAAVIRIGLKTTRDLVICLSVKQLFIAKSPLLKTRMQKLYEHSVEVAAIAYILANKTTHLVADDMLLAGLVHDIGVIPILTYIDQIGLDIDSMEQVEEIINDLRSVVGSMVISNWALSPELLAVIENAENWHRDTSDNVDMCDVILASQIYFRLQHHQLKNLPKLDQVPAFRKLFPDHQDPELIKEILDQAKEEVEAVKRLLRI